MKIEKLTIGLKVKNYKALCELLEEEIKEGNSKKAQLKQWEQYFTWHKEGNAFVIDSIGKKVEQFTYINSVHNIREENNTIINKDYVSKCSTFANVKNIPREKVTDEIVIEVKESELSDELMMINDIRKNCMRLEIGKEYSYKELCEILEIKYTHGDSKNKQFEIINRYVKFEKNGKGKGVKYMINNIDFLGYDEEINENTYINELSKMLESECVTNDNINLIGYFSKNKLAIDIGLVNKNYTQNIGNNDYFRTIDEDNEDMSNYERKLITNDIFDNINRKVDREIEKVLKKMRSNCICCYSKQWILIDGNGVSVSNAEICTNIMKCIQQVYTDYSIEKALKNCPRQFGRENIIKNASIIYNNYRFLPNDKKITFKEDVTKYLKEIYPNAQGCYYGYVIITDKELVGMYTWRNQSRMDSYKNNNDKFFKLMVKAIEENYEKALQGETAKSYKAYEDVRKEYKCTYISILEDNLLN